MVPWHSCSVISTLATEEKGKIVSIAVRPGKVDTAVRFPFVFVPISFAAYQSVDAKQHS
jgi:hypothetical protein